MIERCEGYMYREMLGDGYINRDGGYMYRKEYLSKRW